MKKLIMAAGLTAFLFSCNDEKTDSATTVTDSTTNTTTNTTANTAKRAQAEGDVTYRGGKVMVWKNNAWVEADADVKMEKGYVVRKNGRIVRDGEEYEFKEGVVVSREGDFFDDAGDAIQDGWDGVKKGWKNVKEEVKDVFKDDAKKKKENN